nr:uncharacterized protein LOC131778039 [Pocillopora verrucosa]
MAVLVKICCCGCSLRIGALLIGIFGLIFQAIILYNQSKALIKYNQANIDWDSYEGYLPVDKKHIRAIIALAYVTLAFKVISVLCNVSLLISVGTKNIYLAVVWLVWNILDFACSVVVTSFLLSVSDVFIYADILIILWWLLTIYFMIVVHSYIEALREDPSGASAGFPRAHVYQFEMIGLRYARPCALPPNTAVTSHIGVGYPPACAVPDKNTMTPQAGYVYPPPYPALTSYTDVGNPPHHPMAGKITLSSYDDTGYLPSHTAHGRTTMTSQDGSGHPPAYTDPGTTAVMSQNGNSSQHTVPAKAMVTYVGSE